MLNTFISAEVSNFVHLWALFKIFLLGSMRVFLKIPLCLGQTHLRIPQKLKKLDSTFIISLKGNIISFTCSTSSKCEKNPIFFCYIFFSFFFFLKILNRKSQFSKKTVFNFCFLLEKTSEFFFTIFF